MVFKDIAGIVALIGMVFTAGVVFTSMRSDIETLKSHDHNDGSLVIPKNAVVSFGDITCPTGWKEYVPAYGVFIRGIDRSGTNIDPSGERAIANLQVDELKTHNHVISHWTGPGPYARHTLAHTNYTNQETAQGGGKSGMAGGEETRPKNIALLYCIKL